MQRQERLEVQDSERLRIERAPAIDVSFAKLAGQRIRAPVLRVRRNHIHVVKQHERRLGPALQPSPDVAPARCRFRSLVADPLRIENPPKELDAAGLVARRIHGVDPQVLLHPADRVIPTLAPARILTGHTGRHHDQADRQHPARTTHLTPPRIRGTASLVRPLDHRKWPGRYLFARAGRK